jgi:hypothetical protein
MNYLNIKAYINVQMLVIPFEITSIAFVRIKISVILMANTIKVMPSFPPLFLSLLQPQIELIEGGQKDAEGEGDSQE